MSSAAAEVPPPLPARAMTVPPAATETPDSSDFHLSTAFSSPEDGSVQGDQISLYVCKCPGSEDVLVTPTKPAQGGITDFDVKHGAYILQYDDEDEYREAVKDFNDNKASLPARAFRRMSRPVNAAALCDITNAKQTEPDSTALDRLIEEAERQAQASAKTTPFQGLRARGDSLQKWAKPREAKLSDSHETRNFHQMPLAARGLVAANVRPMTLLRIGFLPDQSREIGEVARMLDNGSSSNSNGTHAPGKDAAEAAGYIDILEQAYEPFGTDVNYVSPSWIKTFTRRLSRWKGAIDEEFTMLSPWQGQCIFVPLRARNTIRCYHTFSTSSADRVLVSELRLNLFPPGPSLTRRHQHRRTSSSSGGESTPVDVPKPVKRSSGSFPIMASSAPSHDINTHDADSNSIAHGRASISGDFPRPMEHTSQNKHTQPGRSRASSGSVAESDRNSKRTFNFSAFRKRIISDDHGPVARAAAVLDRMDLSLGQERLGGGLRGRDVKLAKIVVYAPGQQFLDLLVAANMLLFNRAWQLARHE